MTSGPARAGSAAIACPLCGETSNVVEREIETAPLVAYWRSMQYDLAAAFPSLPKRLERRRCQVCDLRFFKPQLIGGPDLYRALGKTQIYYSHGKWEFEEVLRLLSGRPRGGSLLELGCGRGWFLERAAPLFDRAVGIDFNDDAVRECRRRGLDVRQDPVESLDETFDVVASFQVLEHLADPGAALRSLAQRLNPGGLLILAVPNEDSLLGEIREGFLNFPPHHASLWTRNAFESAADLFSLSFEDYRCEPLRLQLLLTAENERLVGRYPVRRGIMRFVNALRRRAGLLVACVRFLRTRRKTLGQTHIAFLRKPA